MENERVNTKIIYSDTVLFRDEDTWIKYPQYRIWHNKLWLANELGYSCGPCGVFVPKDDYYVVRPVINISGYGVNSKLIYLTTEEYFTAPPGYFWCEYFKGNHCSFDYVKKDNKWVQVSCWEGIKYNENEMFKFKKWFVADHVLELPPLFDQLDIPNLNIEAIGGKIIEVHLREGNYNEEGWTQTIPVWEGEHINHEEMLLNKYIFVEPEAEHSRGIEMLPQKLLGYYVK